MLLNKSTSFPSPRHLLVPAPSSEGAIKYQTEGCSLNAGSPFFLVKAASAALYWEKDSNKRRHDRLADYPEGLHIAEAKAIFRNTYSAQEMRSYTF